MNFDLESKVMSSVTQLFGLVMKETSTETQFQQAIEDLVRDVLERHPDVDVGLLFFSMGRALGRMEGQKEGTR